MNWQLIETANKKGPPIDVWVPGEFPARYTDVSWSKSQHVCLSQYCDSCPKDLNIYGWRDPLSDERLKPSHWMPIPAPPSAQDTKP